ncbi:alpha/beta hydrolase [Nodosilinea sp. LEGE 07298]|uniref:alpha/beta hydrolase n=1 Tax=Nodosilinea sp. LEGE 07298 TaxID=2777970 RepID=UPI00187F6520|nr:alpha/beta hydrolase [Nodosilinea sp. LEGE 07298]MBE9109285.1 alpha/beta hydrolase [Nodosilinea sp. LEGE 07298]
MRAARRTSQQQRPNAFLVRSGQALAWLLAGSSLGLSLWIIVPAPTRFLLPLGVGAPEISPWLAGLSAIAAIAVWLTHFRGKVAATREAIPAGIALGTCAIALSLSLLPLTQVSSTSDRIAAEMRSVLGPNYLAHVPPSLLDRLRPQPFQLQAALGGITPASEPIAIERGIVFATPADVPLRLNVYRPSAAGTYPTLVVIYGGAWQGGSPNSQETFSRYMAAQGYTVVAIDYRHAPQYPFPAQIEDVRAALTYLKTHGAELGADLTRLALMGRSAGAQLAAIAAYQQPQIIPIRAVVNYYGPVNLTTGYDNPPVPDPIDTRAVLRAFLGGTPDQVPNLYRQASPINYVRPGLPPTLLVYAGRDHVVQAKYGHNLYRQLQATGNQAVWLKVPWSEHAFDILFNGVGNQVALYYTERFLAWALYSSPL